MAKYLLSEASAAGLHRLLAAEKNIEGAQVRQTRENDGEPLELPAEIAIWRVEWFGSLKETGSFAIFLGNHPLNIGGGEIAPGNIGGATKADGILGDVGWHALDEFESGDLWLVIDSSSSSGSVSVSLAAEKAVGDKKVNIHVAKAEKDEDTGAVTVEQSLVGELVLGAGGGGGGGGSDVGYDGDMYGDPRLEYNTDGSYSIELWAKRMTFVKGALMFVGDKEKISSIATTPHSTSMD